MPENFYLLLPIGVILLAALAVVFLDLVLDRKDRYILPWMGIGGCILGMVSVFQVQGQLPEAAVWFRNYASAPQPSPLILGGAFCIDHFGLFIWILSCLAGALAIFASPPQSEDSALSTGEYHGLILLAVSGMMLLGVSHDWLTLLISLEIMSIATYILTGSNRDDLRSNEAGLKYLVLGAFSTAFLLMGMAFYYGAFGSISLTPDAVLWGVLPPEEQTGRIAFVIISMGLLLVGTLFKIGAAPFHFWVPDVYQGAPTPVTGLMAFGVKAAAFAVVARLCFETFGAPEFRERWIPLILVIAVLTMIIGNILAMRQTNLKRLLAYSGIAHTGYLLLAFLIVPIANESAQLANPARAEMILQIEEHMKAVVFYLLVYGVMTLGAFGVIALIRQDGRPMEEMEDYTGLAKEHPGIALCMAAFMLSLAGMPPLGGFFAKFLIFRAAIEQGDRAIVIAAVIGILTSVASLYYYLRVIVVMYMSPTEETAASGAQPRPAQVHFAWNSNLLIYVAAALTLLIGLMPGWFY